MGPSQSNRQDLAKALTEVLMSQSYKTIDEGFTLLKSYCVKAQGEAKQLLTILEQHKDFLNGLNFAQLFDLGIFFDGYYPTEWNEFIESIENEDKKKQVVEENKLRNAFQDLAYLVSTPDKKNKSFSQEAHDSNRAQHFKAFEAYRVFYLKSVRTSYTDEKGTETHLLAIKTRYQSDDKHKLDDSDYKETSLNAPLLSSSFRLNMHYQKALEIQCAAVKIFIDSKYQKIDSNRPKKNDLKKKLETKPGLSRSLSSVMPFNSALRENPLSRSSPNVLVGHSQPSNSLSKAATKSSSSLSRSDSLQSGVRRLDLSKVSQPPVPEPTPTPTLTPIVSDSTQMAEPLLTDKKSTSQLIIDPTRVIIGAAIALAIATVAFSFATGGLAAIPMFSMALVMGASAFTGGVTVESLFQSAEKIKQRVHSVAKFLDKINVDPTEVLIGAGMALVIVVSVVAMTVATGGLAIPALAAVAAMAVLVIVATAGSFSFLGICRSIAGRKQPASSNTPASPRSAWVPPAALSTPRTKGTQFETVPITPGK